MCALVTGVQTCALPILLAAIGRDRSSVYLAPLCAIRPVSGQIPADLGPPLAEIALHRLALCRPKRLLLMGNAASRALLGVNAAAGRGCLHVLNHRSEEHTSELQSLMRISYAVFCLKKKKYKH